jgi:hypothetical protein
MLGTRFVATEESWARLYVPTGLGALTNEVVCADIERLSRAPGARNLYSQSRANRPFAVNYVLNFDPASLPAVLDAGAPTTTKQPLCTRRQSTPH